MAQTLVVRRHYPVMTKSEKQWWERERAKGYDLYLLYSIRRRGLPAGIVVVLSVILCSWFRDRPSPSFLELVSWFGVSTLMFGLTIGRQNWRDNEQDYQNPSEEDDRVD